MQRDRSPARFPGLVVAAAAGLVALLTLTPAGGAGWAWGAPLVELRWYLDGLGSDAVRLQLVGNLLLLAPLAAAAVLRWPALRSPAPLTAAAVATGAAVELLQLLLPLGRVVSPLDAALNAGGAVAVGLVVAALAACAERYRRPGIEAGVRG
ncbi:VanZ family protein [Geodermatophilus marinus]|uniref:VanZ family protein n=1 Tax=Geodermatophilus sp. LHW52908 TaxID=2303986 RepID=UPI000E3DD1EE|nr:VanZ family protein [Geodermatophilus sp. LHW52908]RFU23208.1 VanZ family protein [Geodermatophilus sp. LHW52908]